MAKKLKLVATEADALRENIPLEIFRKRWLILATLCGSLLVVMISNSSLNLAVPSLSLTLGLTSIQLTWVVEAYSLAFAGLLLTAGSVGDRYGRKLIMQIGLVIFLIASIYAAFIASSGTELILTRLLMGVGGAMVMPTTLSILNVIFPAAERTRAIAIWGAISSIGVLFGSVVSGFLLEHFEWESVFVFSGIVAIIVLIVNQILTVESKDEMATPVDWLGGFLSTIGLVGIVYAIMEMSSHGIDDPAVLTSLIGGFACIGLFVWWQHKAKNPMLDMELFKKASFSISAITVSLVFFGLMGISFAMSQMFQLVMGYAPMTAALLTIPIMLPLIILTPVVPKVLNKIGTRWTVVIGMSLVTTGFLVSSLWPATPTYWQVLGSISILVAGIAFASTPATDMLMSSVPKNRSGMGSAVNDTTRELGGALGIAVLGAIMSAKFLDNLKPSISKLPIELQEVAEKSLAGSLGVADAIGKAGDAFAYTAKEAWMGGVSDALIIAAIICAIATFIAAVALPHKGEDLNE